jgi:excisionase family DNA binding protein
MSVSEKVIHKRLLKIKEAAAYMGLSTKRIRSLVHNGELAFHQFEEFGNWWIDIRDLDAYLEKHKRTHC